MYLGYLQAILSRLFKKEMGISISAYIRQQKIDMAKNLLRFSDYSMIDIAISAFFFFTEVILYSSLREVEGITPKKYRDEYSYGTVGSAVRG